jgi:hypothetical protein
MSDDWHQRQGLPRQLHGGRIRHDREVEVSEIAWLQSVSSDLKVLANVELVAAGLTDPPVINWVLIVREVGGTGTTRLIAPLILDQDPYALSNKLDLVARITKWAVSAGISKETEVASGATFAESESLQASVQAVEDGTLEADRSVFDALGITPKSADGVIKIPGGTF